MRNSIKRAKEVLIVAALISLMANLSNGQSSAAQDSTSQYLALERRGPEQISPVDAALLKARSKDVVRAAAFFGIDLEQGSWSYQQSVCPVMPKHLIVNYVRQESGGVQTQFAAIVPRGSEPVRVVPVQRSGLAPFAAPETSANSAILFNHAWAAEGGNIKTIESESTWITLGLCYAEMVGSHPLIVTGKPLVERQAGTPTLRYETRGGASAMFTDVGMASGTWGWTLQFDRKGTLKHVAREKGTGRSAPRPSEVLAQSAHPISPQLIPSSSAYSTAGSIALVVPPAAAAETYAISTDTRNTQVEPEVGAPQGHGIRVIPDAQEAPQGRMIPAPQELPETPTR